MLAKLVQVSQVGGRVNRLTYAKRWSAGDTIGAITEFNNPSDSAATPRLGFLNYPNKVTCLKVLLGGRLPLKASVQRRYVFSYPTGPDRISVRLRTGETFKMVKFINTVKKGDTGAVFSLKKVVGRYSVQMTRINAYGC